MDTKITSSNKNEACHSKAATDSLELREAFKLFDADKDGEVTVKELHNIFEKLSDDNRIRRSEIQALLRAADTDKNGTINYQVKTTSVV